MLDDLRDSDQFENNDILPDEEYLEEYSSGDQKRFLGLTSRQRFVVALLLFIIVAAVGTYILIVFQKMLPPV